MEARKAQQNRVGIHFTGTYLLIVVGLYAYTVYQTKPEYVGYDWIPMYLLSMPWAAIPGLRQCLLAGLALNTGVLYLLGRQAGKLHR